MKMPSFKRTILLVGAPAILVAGGLTTMAASAATPTTAPSQQSQPEVQTGTAAEPADSAAESTTESSTSAAEKAAEAAMPGGGHADDPTNANADNQFDGVQ